MPPALQEGEISIAFFILRIVNHPHLVYLWQTYLKMFSHKPKLEYIGRWPLLDSKLICQQRFMMKKKVLYFHEW